MPSPHRITVRGGSDGIEAHCEDLLALGHEYASAGWRTGDCVLALHGYLAHPAVLAATPIDPVGASAFAAELLTALDGPGGLSWHALECAALSVALRAAVASYQGADALQQRFLPAIEGGLYLPIAAAQALPALIGGDPTRALDVFVTADPQLADTGVDVISGFWSDHLLTDTVATYPDGRPHVTAAGLDRAGGAPPHSLQDVLVGLSHRNDGRAGDIDVSFVVGPDGRRRVIVNIPGTKNWNPLPGPNVTDPATNLRALEGAPTTYQAGVLEAMRRAGVTSTDEVLLVGHSQGGMVALNTASAATRSGEFRITHVITAGSPIARIPTPRSVQVLALENAGDVVPHADGASNPDRTNVTTVSVEHNHGRILDNHSLPDSYIPGAADIDAATNRSTRDYLAGLQPFLTGERMQTQIFHIQRR